jgi:hypothetical protein
MRPAPCVQEALAEVRRRMEKQGVSLLEAKTLEPAATMEPSSTEDQKSVARGSELPPRPGGAPSADPMEKCEWCRRLTTLDGSKLKECTGCRSVRYCGTACQVADWANHKARCKKLRTASQG